MSNFMPHLYVGSKFYKCGHHPLMLQFQDHGYFFCTPPPFLRTVDKTFFKMLFIPRYLNLNLTFFLARPCRLHRLWHVAAGQHTFLNIPEGLYTYMYSDQGHATSMFCHWSKNFSEGLHNVSCA